MSVLNVLSTNTVAAGATEYQVIQTGYYRVGSTAGAATVSLNGGPAITLVQNEFILLKGGKPGQAKIVKAVDDSTADYILGQHIHSTGDAHPFSAGDFIAVEDNSTSPAIDSNFFLQELQVKKLLLLQETKSLLISIRQVHQQITLTLSQPQAIVKRCIKIVAATSAVIIEEIQVVGG
ncbi:MAG: hypothetical protein CM15mV28_0610 [Thaumasvirus sp.]|nr:MAG: hypothetical protein CM15mV28_0610 [Thaumasvirus sp.]